MNASSKRAFQYMGLGFSGLGVVIASYLAISVGFDPRLTAFLLILFSGVGFGPLLLSEVPVRGWRPRVELRLDNRGIALVDSAGHAEWLAWDDPSACVTVREIVGGGPHGRSPEPGEWLILIPKVRTAHIGAEARVGLLAACRAHGFIQGEDRFDVPNQADHGRTAVAAVLRMAARPPPGGTFGPSPPPTSAPLPESPLPPSDSTFPAPSLQPSYTAGAAATETNPIAEVTVTPEGARIGLRDGKVSVIEWRLPRLRVELFAILPSPVATLRDAPAWRLSVRKPACSGSVSPGTYTALTESAKAAGLMVTTFRFPRPDRGSIGWGAHIAIRRVPPP